MDPCAFDSEGLVYPKPYELRMYPSFDIRQVACTLAEYQRDHGEIPESKQRLVDRVRGSIEKEGLRNPLIIQWFTEDPRKPVRWMVTIGNNRWMALSQLGMFEVPALVLFPKVNDGADPRIPPLSGDYELVPFMVALARFDATYPWWNSAVMRSFCPSLVPRSFTG